MRKNYKLIILLSLLLAGFAFMKYQKPLQPFTGYTIASYNVENLFDTIDDPHARDNDFMPQGKYKWDSKRYHYKLTQLSKVIEKLGDDDGPEIIGLCEVENASVLQDLIAQPLLKEKSYRYIHYEGHDERGIDNALLYKADRFKLLNSKNFIFTVNGKEEFKTRPVLCVKGVINQKDTIHFLVNHWPSRRGGKEAVQKRIKMGMFVREIVDSLLQRNAQEKIIVMGDFNDEPADESLQIALYSGKDAAKGKLYNPFYELQLKGEGTSKYKHEWNMLDQILLSEALSGKVKGCKYLNTSAAVYHPEWMYYKNSIKEGPYRTFLGDKYYGGYSDHFPVYVWLK
jgi:predicted extracellular nuclease